MTKVVLDDALRSKLNGLNEQLELCDETGKTLGRFLPESSYRQTLYAAVEAVCPHGPEEREQLRKATGGMSLAEFWKRLGRT